MDEPIDVAVIGAGIAGLATALLLTQAGHRVRVDERDASTGSRDQGGSIGISDDLGRAVIRRMGLDDAFAAIADTGAASARVSGADGVTVRSVPNDPDSGDTEVERPLLRRMLLDALPDGTVRWGRRVTGIERTADGRRVRLLGTEHDHDGDHDGDGDGDGDGTVVDLVVGGDGAWSRVRAALGAAEPTYSGITFLDRRFPDVERGFPALAETIGRGTLFALEGGLGLVAQRIGTNARVYVAFRAGLDWVQATPPAELRQVLATAFADAGWDRSLLRLVTDGTEPGTLRPVFEHPVGHRWERRLPATLVGDAAHLQSPFCALGTNGALMDAADLVDALAAAPTVEAALIAYETTMWRRSEVNAAAAHQKLRAGMHVDAPAHFTDPRNRTDCRPSPDESVGTTWVPDHVAPLVGTAVVTMRA